MNNTDDLLHQKQHQDLMKALVLKLETLDRTIGYVDRSLYRLTLAIERAANRL